MHVSMTTLSAEVAYDSALTQQLLKKPRTLGDYMEIEKQLRAAAAEIERLHARVLELEEALAATRMDIRWHTCEESSECLACDEDALIEKPHHED